MATRAMHVSGHVQHALQAPMEAGTALVAGIAVVFAGASYCMGYEFLSGGTNEWARATGWSLGAVLPWFILFEAVKRIEVRNGGPLGWTVLFALLALTGLASLAAEHAIDWWVWRGSAAPIGLQLLRRLPAVGVLLLLLYARRAGANGWSRAATFDAAIDPQRLRYVRAADNYVELHYPGRMEMVRGTLAGVEGQLGAQGFVRVHRSILVHPRHVSGLEASRRTPTLVLDDGTRLPTGERFRAALRHFVP